jgi:uncharacterized protein YbjT (DUF2867 family)
MTKTIVVAGASGELGQHVVRALATRGWRVRALVRDPARLGPVRDAVAEVHVGDALAAGTLAGAFDGASAAFSCVGASVKMALGAGWRGYRAVDVPANTNLIAAARGAGVERFAYVSTSHTDAMRRLNYVRAHEDVVERLRASGMDWRVVRPTGFFSALGVFVDMARGGSVPEFGDGATRTNPIHDADLADVCAAALDSTEREHPAGGPDVFTRREIAELAFAAVGRPHRIRRLPPWLARLASVLMRPVSPRMADFMAFVAALATNDTLAPASGHRRLGDYFRERAGAVASGGR